MRCHIAVTVLLIGTLAVSGCSSSSPGDQKQPEDLFKAALTSESAPEGFHDQLPLKSCGQVTLDQGEQIPIDAVDCIDTAIGTLDTELAVGSPTTEGDPIVALYRTSTDTPGVQISTDTAFDRFGPKTWTHQNCHTTITLASLRGCTET